MDALTAVTIIGCIGAFGVRTSPPRELPGEADGWPAQFLLLADICYDNYFSRLKGAFYELSKRRIKTGVLEARSELGSFAP